MALSLLLVYIPIPRLPDGPKPVLFGSKLTWSIYSGIDIMAKSIGCLWALGITSVSTIISGLPSDMAINSSLFGSWSMLVYNRLIFENVTSVSLDLLRLLESFRSHNFTLVYCQC